MSVLTMANGGWVKRSSGDGNCVEVATQPGGVILRNSNDPAGPVLAFTAAEWESFTAGVRDGVFDLS